MPDFSSRTRGRGLRRLAAQQPVQQQLMQDAFSLTPDADAVTKAILDKKLYNADMKQPMEEVNTMVVDYMNKFNKDPFYAFTKEGRKTAQNLKAIVNHPKLREWEQNTVAAEDEYKRATTNRVNKNPVVSGNDVLVLKDGKRQYISLNDLKSLNPQKGDHPLDVDSDIKDIRNKWGVREGVPSYDMSKLDDVDQKIARAFTGLGSTEQEWTAPGSEQGVTNKMTRKTNEAQLSTAISTLMSTGLNESDRNTLKSEYIKLAGAGASTQGFQDWLHDSLSGMASGKLSTMRSDLPQKTIGAGAGGGEDGKAYKVTAAHLIFTNKSGNRRVEDSNLGAAQSTIGNLLPMNETLNASTRKSPEGYASRTPMTNKIFSEATDLDNLSILTRGGDGSWIKSPGFAQHGVIVDRPGAQPAMVYQYTYNDANNKPSIVPTRISQSILERQNAHKPLTAEQEKYVITRPIQEAEQEVASSALSKEKKAQQILNFRANVRPDGTVQYLAPKPWIDFSMILPSRRGWWDRAGGSEEKDLGDQAQKAGYQSKEDPRMTEYYSQYGGRANDLDPSGFGHPTIADEFYEVKARVPLISFEQLNTAYGGDSMGSREDVDISSSGLIDNYHVLHNNSAALPNQTGTASKVPTRSQIQ